MSASSILKELQAKVKVSKSHTNSFGGFNYRKAEDIYNAVKEQEKTLDFILIMSDDLVFNGEQAYIKATATIRSLEDNEEISATAIARIDFDKAKMDNSQRTGSASSYARKYALSGLLLLDDSTDADEEAIGQKKVGEMIAKSLHDRCKGDEELEKYLLKAMGIKKWADLINDHYYILNENWDKYKKSFESKKEGSK